MRPASSYSSEREVYVWRLQAALLLLLVRHSCAGPLSRHTTCVCHESRSSVHQSAITLLDMMVAPLRHYA